MTRNELYAYIKGMNLQDEVKNEFKKNFTNVSTANLQIFVDNIEKSLAEKGLQDIIDMPCGIGSSLERLVEVLENKKILLKSEVNYIIG